MTIGQWCDTAWALIMRQTPMMANPFEYRETLWGLLYEGEQPRTRKPDTSDKPKAKGPKALPPGAGGGLSRRDSNELDRFREELLELRARREAERGSPPPATPTS